MAKITLENGMVLEGTPEELVELAKGFDEEGKPVAEEMEVGDYVKVVNANYRTMRGFKNGDIAEVLFNHHGKGDKDYRLKKINTGTLGYVPKAGGYVVRATKEEVAATKTEVKWTKIGRKLNEYKAGDIIGYKFSKDDETIAYLIKRIVGDELWFYCEDSKKDMYILKSSDSIKFVVPVEVRFDR